MVAYNYTPPRYDNNFDAIMDSFQDGLKGGLGGSNMAPEANSPNMGGAAGSVEDMNGAVNVTDNQVAGVEEADIIKRTRTHAFHLSSTALSAFTIEGAESHMVSYSNIKNSFLSAGIDISSATAREMFLSEDGKRITVLATCNKSGERTSFLGVLSLDVTDPALPVAESAIMISGGYTDARRMHNNY